MAITTIVDESVRVVNRDFEQGRGGSRFQKIRLGRLKWVLRSNGDCSLAEKVIKKEH